MCAKRCTHCGRVLPETDFFKNAKASDGLQSWCKECYRERGIRRIRNKGSKPLPPPPSKIMLEELYINQQYSIKMIADALCTNYCRILWWMKKYGIQRRSVSESKRISFSLGRTKTRKGEKRCPLSPDAKEKLRSLAKERAKNAKGVSKKKNGYVVITVGENKDRGVHVVVMENHIGRRLLPNECVHHINHNRSDNRIENLVLMDKGEHTRLHMRERAESGEDKV